MHFYNRLFLDEALGNRPGNHHRQVTFAIESLYEIVRLLKHEDQNAFRRCLLDRSASEMHKLV